MDGLFDFVIDALAVFGLVILALLLFIFTEMWSRRRAREERQEREQKDAAPKDAATKGDEHRDEAT